MKTSTTLLMTVVLWGVMCWAQTTNAQGSASAAQGTSTSVDKAGMQAASSTKAAAAQSAKVEGGQAQAAGPLRSGTTLQAELTKPLDVRKCKPGDEVVAKATQDVKTDGHVVLPRGSKIVGHITQAQARTKEHEESQMVIAFDHALLKDGTRMPVMFTIQAIARSEAAASMENEPMMGSGMSSGSGRATVQPGGLARVGTAAGGIVNTAGSAAGTTLNTAQGVGGNVSGSLNASSQGTVGLPGVALSSTTNASAGSTISAKGSNLRLESGTRMVLRVN